MCIRDRPRPCPPRKPPPPACRTRLPQVRELGPDYAGALGVWPNVLTRSKPGRRTGPAPKLETIWFVDGPLAGRTDHLPAGPDGLPPHQFCALVARPTHEGGRLHAAIPARPDLRDEACLAIHAGVAPVDIAHPDIGGWPK